MEKYNKLVYALLGAVAVSIGAIYIALDDNVITTKEWVNVLSTFLVPITVYFAPKNKNEEIK